MKPPLLILLFCLMGLQSCNQNKSVTQSPEVTYDYSKILVLLEEGISPKTLIAEFPDYRLKHHGQSSRSQNQHTYYLGVENSKPDELIKAVRNSEIVIEADYLSTPN